jgi:8-oxo-dGTP pyrophosphatase MutT (NUDIX family)
MQSSVCLVKAIIVYNFKFLVLIRRKDGLLDLPGGHLEKGEGVWEGLFRELSEETSLVVGMPEAINQWTLLSKNGVSIIGMTFFCDLIEGRVVLSQEHKAFYWQDLDKINQFTPPEWVIGFWDKYLMKGESYEIYRDRAIRGTCRQYAGPGRHYRI